MATEKDDIAIVGVSGLFPKASTTEDFWHNIVSGTDAITEVPEDHWRLDDYYDENPKAADKTYAKTGGFIPTVTFDAMEWGIPPQVIPSTDTSQLLSLIVAKKLLADVKSCRDFTKQDHSRTSVVMGVTSAQELLVNLASRLQRPIWEKSLRESGIDEEKIVEVCEKISGHYTPWQENSFPGLLGNVIAGRIANRLDLGGSNCVCDAACASALSALSLGINELRVGQSDLVIAGGVDTFNDIFMYMCFSKTPALSPTGDCRPFSKAADGTILGEGIGMVALKRLSDAVRDKDRIYSVIRGVGQSSDGQSSSIYAPKPEGQAVAIRRAYEAAGYRPDTVELVEAHGTGTKAGDKAELTGLTAVFKNEDGLEPWCSLGSIKSQIGHTKAAAGIAGLIKATLALYHKTLPPTIKVEEPNPEIDFQQSAFAINTFNRPWIRGKSHPRRAAVSSFGFGGSNYHVTLEEYQDARLERFRPMGWEIVAFSAESATQLLERLEDALAKLTGADALSFLSFATAKIYQASQQFRLVILAASTADLKEKLRKTIENLDKEEPLTSPLPKEVFIGVGDSQEKLAYVFAGQGSQYLQMGSGIHAMGDGPQNVWDNLVNFPISKKVGLNQVVYPPQTFQPESQKSHQERLTNTKWAQPAIAAVTAMQLELLKGLKVKADCMAGHSFGEVSALYGAGVLNQESYFKIAIERGRLMDKAAAGDGAMTALSMPYVEAKALLADVEGVEIANDNAPKQVVISGSHAAIEKAEQILKTAGKKGRRLQVGAAFHSVSMASAAEAFGEFLSPIAFNDTDIEVFANKTASLYPQDPKSKKELLTSQIASPVKFREQITQMAESGVKTFLEVGPNRVLSSLIKSCLKGGDHKIISLDAKQETTSYSFMAGIAQLAAIGHVKKLAALWQGYRSPANPWAAPQAKMPFKINGTTYGKPYPKGSAENKNYNFKPQKSQEPMVTKEAPITMTVIDAKQQPEPKLHSSGPKVATSSQSLMLQQMSVAHKAYLEAIAGAHVAYLKATEAGFQSLGKDGDVASAPTNFHMPVPSIPGGDSAQEMNLDTAEDRAGAVFSPKVQPPTTQQTPPPASTPETIVPTPTPTAQGAANELPKQVIIEAIATSTGFPKAMLKDDMHLENDLGIDSIKRVEILSIVEESLPAFGQNHTAELAAAATIKDLFGFIAAEKTPATEAPNRSATSEETHEPKSDRTAVIMRAISEATGFPTDMLKAEMHLENDLGVDSIKKVEILSILTDEFNLQTTEEENSALAAAPTIQKLQEILNKPAGTDAQEVGKPASPKPLRFTLNPVPTPSLGMVDTRLFGMKRILIVSQQPSLAGQIAETLQSFNIKAFAAEDIDAGCDGLILVGLSLQSSDPEQLYSFNRWAFGIAKSFASQRQPKEYGIFITIQETGGCFGLDQRISDAGSAGLAALAKTAGHEWSNLDAKAIDIDSRNLSERSIGKIIAKEVACGGPETEVALKRGEERFTFNLTPESIEATTSGVKSGDVFIVSGGARGITAACMLALAKTKNIKLALLGRSQLITESSATSGVADPKEMKLLLLKKAAKKGQNLTPIELNNITGKIIASRQIRQTLESLSSLGSEATYLQTDITDRRSVSKALEFIEREWGQVDFIVHGAGVIKDKLIIDKTEEQFSQVWQPKVTGLINLLEETRQDDLKGVFLFSSVSARVGNKGQVDYAMANETMNKIAQQEALTRPKCLVRSLAFGPWEGGMVTPALKKQFTAMGTHVLSTAEGTSIFAREFCGTTSDVEVSIGGVSFENSKTAEQDRDFFFTVPGTNSSLYQDHSINERAVVPMVAAGLWFNKAMTTVIKEAPLVQIQNLQVMKGLFLNADTPLELNLELTQKADVYYRGRLVDTSGALYYQCSAKGEKTMPELPESGQWSSDQDEFKYELYGDTLFHGSHFQVLDTITSIGESGLDAVIQRPKSPTIEDASIENATAILDGALQAALVWSRHLVGKKSLPTSIGKMVIGRLEGKGSINCRLFAKNHSKNKTVCDIYLHKDGIVLAYFEDTTVHLLPTQVPKPTAEMSSNHLSEKV